MSNTPVTAEELAALGFTAASDKAVQLQNLKRKCAIAYEHFRYVTPKNVEDFNKKLRDNTYDPSDYSYQHLSFTPVEKYPQSPPAPVLEAMRAAVNRQCFDSFEVAHIVTKKEIPDPILFGRIKGCDDRFFISQWDDDVKIEDIISEREG